MANAKFLWDTNIEGTSGDIVFNSKSVSFGDGYEQDISMGINTTKRNWSWEIIDDLDKITAIENFLIATKGSTVFDWESPRGWITVKVTDLKCLPLGGKLWKLSGTFLQRAR